MSEENVEIALQQIDAFNRRDADAAVAFASPNVEWEDSMFWTEHARTYCGREELRDWVNRILEPWRASTSGPTRSPKRGTAESWASCG